MTKVKSAIIAAALAVAACSPAPETAQSEAMGSAIPEEFAALASAAAPGISITGGDLNASGNQYEVTGNLPSGDEVEIDIMTLNGAWMVVEIQRDIEWSAVPQAVRTTAAAAPDSFEPVRVIESTQIADGSLVYELFRATGNGVPSGGPDMEVRWHQGSADVIP